MEAKAKHENYVTLADTGTRLVAIIIDNIILGILGGILFGGFGEVGGGISVVLSLAYYWFFWTRMDGQSPGKRMMKIRIIKADGSQLSDTDALIRAVGYYVSGMIFMLGYIWALFDDNRRTWHDLLAGTLVVKA